MTTRILRPDGTVTSSSTSVTGGGGTIHGATSDSSTGSYVSITAPNGGFLVTLASYTLAAGEVVRSYRVVSQAKTAVNWQQDQVSLCDALGNVYPGTAGNGYLPSASWAQTWCPTVSAPLTQAQIDGLCALVQWPDWDAGTGPQQIAEVWAELVVASPPVVQNTGPTVAQTVANPVLTAQYAWGSDGEAQSAIRWKVFSQAQYTAGGFDPETSTPTYDSGVLYTTSTSHTVATPLASGVTYRAYVRGAHRINGVDYWSTSWHTNAAWSVTYTPTVISSVVIVPDPPSGSCGVLVNRNTGTPAWSSIEVQRSDDGGTTWVPVRGATGKGASNTFLTWGANSATVNDFEVANGQSAIWRARATNVAAGAPVTGAWVQSSASSWSHTSVWLKCPTNPARNVVVELHEKAPEPVYPLVQGVFQVVGKSVPVVVSDSARGAGTAKLVVDTYAYSAAAQLKASLDVPSVMLLHTPAGVGRLRSIYFVPGSCDEVYWSVAEEWQVWSIDMTITERPADDTP